MADELDSSSSEFSPLQVPLFLILLWNKVFWKAKLRIVVKKQLTLNAKVLMVNGKNHQRQKLMVVQACFDKIAKYTYCGRIYQCGFLSDEEAKNVDSELRKRLPKSPRMKAFKERWKIALHFTSEGQLENFNLLNVGFCRKFATPANQCYENNVPKDRKASLSVAWMKVL